MAAQDKTVKITIVVDPASADLAKRKIVEIKDSVDSLVKAAQQAARDLGSLGMGVKMGTVAGSAGTSSATQAAHGGGGPAGAVQSILSMGVAGAAGSTKKFSEDLKKDAKSMKDVFKDLADAQAREVERMTSGWSKAKASVRGFLSFGRGEYGPAMGQPEAGGGAGRGAAGGKGGGGGFISQAASALGVPPWAMGAAGIGGAILGAGLYGFGAWGAQLGAQNANALNMPLYGSNVAAQGGGMFGGNANAIRHGDLARAWAISQVKGVKEYGTVTSDAYKDEIKTRIAREAPVTFGEAAKTGRLGAIWDLEKSKVGATIADLTTKGWAGVWRGVKRGFTLGLAGNDIDQGIVSVAQQARIDATASHAMDQAKARQMLVENFMKANPVFGSQMNEFFGGALGDMGLSRAAGISGAFVKRRDGTYGDSVADFNKQALGMGISGGELAGLRQSMGATAGRGFFYNGGALLSPQAGGLSNAAQIFGVGAQFNGGGFRGAQSFMNTIQGGIGRGGLDVTAGVQVAGLGMGAMTNGRFQANSGSGFMRSLMAASSGGSTGADMRNAREVAMGFQAMDSGVFGGGIDNLQKALNYSTAMEVAGNLSWQTQKTLANMDAGTMMEVLRNPNSAQATALKAKGVTAELIRSYFASSNQRTFSRLSGDMLSDRGQQALASFQAAGGSTRYMKGLKGKAMDQATSDLAGLFELDRGWSTGQARGYVRNLMAMEGTIASPRGRGARQSTTMKSNRGQVLRTQGEQGKRTGDALAKAEHEGHILSTAVGNMTGEQEAEDKANSAARAAAGGGDLNNTIDQISQLLRTFVGQLHHEIGGSAGPPG